MDCRGRLGSLAMTNTRKFVAAEVTRLACAYDHTSSLVTSAATRMRSRLLPALTVLVCSASFATATHASVLDWIFPKRDVQVIAVTDTTPAGALRCPVTPANPVYYMAVNAGFRDFGGIIAGDKIPPKEQVLQTIAK